MRRGFVYVKFLNTKSESTLCLQFGFYYITRKKDENGADLHVLNTSVHLTVTAITRHIIL
jgi:tRNA A-37 threonylcarbamoyl transferase component Bud32